MSTVNLFSLFFGSERDEVVVPVPCMVCVWGTLTTSIVAAIFGVCVCAHAGL